MLWHPALWIPDSRPLKYWGHLWSDRRRRPNLLLPPLLEMLAEANPELNATHVDDDPNPQADVIANAEASAQVVREREKKTNESERKKRVHQTRVSYQEKGNKWGSCHASTGESDFKRTHCEKEVLCCLSFKMYHSIAECASKTEPIPLASHSSPELVSQVKLFSSASSYRVGGRHHVRLWWALGCTSPLSSSPSLHTWSSDNQQLLHFHSLLTAPSK